MSNFHRIESTARCLSLPTASNPVHSFVNGTTFRCSPSYHATRRTINNITRDRCVASVSLNSDSECIFLGLQQPCCIQGFRNLSSFNFPPQVCPFTHLVWVSHALLLFFAYPLILHYTGLHTWVWSSRCDQSRFSIPRQAFLHSSSSVVQSLNSRRAWILQLHAGWVLSSSLSLHDEIQRNAILTDDSSLTFTLRSLINRWPVAPLPFFCRHYFGLRSSELVLASLFMLPFLALLAHG